MKPFQIFAAVMALVFFSGCASRYITPTGKANLSAISNPAMRESFSAKPAASFPAGIATVRLQDNRYRNYHLDREGGVFGNGRYSVVLVKEVEDDADFQRLRDMPQVGRIISLSRLLLPEKLVGSE